MKIKRVSHGFVLALLFLIVIVFSACENVGNNNNQDNNDDNNNNTPTISKWQLWSNGTQLRGANIYTRRVYTELDGNEFMGSGSLGPPFKQEDFDLLAQMGANYVNISHAGIFDETPPYQFSEEIFNHLQQLIEMIGKADMFAVVSFRTGPGRSEFTFFWGEEGDWFDAGYYNDTIWTEQEAQDNWVDMWQETARRLKDNPYVVGYDLMVEPNANDVWFDLWDPGEYHQKYGGTLYDWNQLYPLVTNAIRQEDEDTPILVGGMGYSAVEWLPYVTPTGDQKTVYTIHQYVPFLYTHQEPDGDYTYPGFMDTDWDGDTEYVDKAWLDNLLQTVDDFKTDNGDGIIVACNEYGVVRWIPGGALFMDDLMDLFEKRGMNYALWEWACSHEPFTSEVNAFNFRFGPNPNTITNMESSELLNTIKKYWAQNTHRPSNTSFPHN